MDIKTFEELANILNTNDIIELIDAKIERLKKIKMKLIRKEDLEQSQLSMEISEYTPPKKLEIPNGDIQEIHEIIEKNGRPMSPKEISEELKEKGSNISYDKVRQILSQHRGRYFKSERRGAWETY